MHRRVVADGERDVLGQGRQRSGLAPHINPGRRLDQMQLHRTRLIPDPRQAEVRALEFGQAEQITVESPSLLYVRYSKGKMMGTFNHHETSSRLGESGDSASPAT